jgi:hypothetical protein
MMINVLAATMSLAVVFILGVALFGWFELSLRRFHGVAAKDVLTEWDAQLAELSEFDREYARAHPPVEVLEAMLAAPSRRPQRFQQT